MAFSDPIVAGVTLVRTAIQSANYVPGVSGWAIFQNGDSEFNDGTFRGDLLVGDAADGFIHITNDPTFGPIIEFIDTGGEVWRLRATRVGTVHNWVASPLTGPAAALAMGYDTATAKSNATVLASDVNITALGGAGTINVAGAALNMNTSGVFRNGMRQPQINQGLEPGGACSAVGLLVVPHGLGVVPTGVQVQLRGGHLVTMCTVVATSAASFTLEFSNTATAAKYNGVVFFFYWQATYIP